MGRKAIIRNKKGTLKAHRGHLKATDKQIGGNHYRLAQSPLKFILANKLNFVDGNIVKYAVRNKKGESLKEKYDKIIHYAELGKELLGE
tara:strand:+ start:118 stop:384 length:267 start_codon:yes stop_codon:yes gene_type:complete